jgi:hypothetical protein
MKSVNAHALEFFTFLHILQVDVKSHRRTYDSVFVVFVRRRRRRFNFPNRFHIISFAIASL